jgi:peptidoglycan/LPS O-acetylase OafA/YrhL
MPPASLQPGQRLPFIDALRGIAAMAVVGNHLYFKNLLPVGSTRLPEPLHWIFAHGHLGVPIFFVLSGFVIPYSIGARHVTPRFFGTFVLRRSIRLDPAYWTVIFLSVALAFASNRFLHAGMPIPSAAQVASHFVYAQDMLGYGNIVGAFWTLCIEFQFYLAFVLLVGLAQWLARRHDGARPGPTYALLFGPLFLWSLAIAVGWLPRPWPGAFVPFWYAFTLGALASWVATARLADGWLAAAVVLVLAATVYAPMETAITALVTVALVYLAVRTGGIARWTLGRPLQYLGRISYSLYLIHIDIGSRVVRIGARKLDTTHSLPNTILVLCAGIVAALIAAHLLYTFVEAPSIRFGQRVRDRLERRKSALAEDLRE